MNTCPRWPERGLASVMTRWLIVTTDGCSVSLSFGVRQAVGAHVRVERPPDAGGSPRRCLPRVICDVGIAIGSVPVGFGFRQHHGFACRRRPVPSSRAICRLRSVTESIISAPIARCNRTPACSINRRSQSHLVQAADRSARQRSSARARFQGRVTAEHLSDRILEAFGNSLQRE